MPLEKYARPGYGPKLASLLGRAAASSIIVGRALESGKRPVFDDGDEVVREGEDGLPAEILVGDHSGAFGEYKLPLETFAAHYARPVNTRDKVVPDPQGFATAYLDAFRDQFLHIQGDYRKRRRAFDTLFKHCKYDPAAASPTVGNASCAVWTRRIPTRSWRRFASRFGCSTASRRSRQRRSGGFPVAG